MGTSGFTAGRLCLVITVAMVMSSALAQDPQALAKPDDRCPLVAGPECTEEECSDDGGCKRIDPSQICCFYNCASMCKTPVNNSSPEAKSCEKNGKTYQNGTSGIDAEDGCNICTCDDGTLECTDNNCACDYNGTKYQSEQKFPASDGCNTCTCDHGLSCTEKACNCQDGDNTRNNGESFPSPDGCNTCTCTNGNVTCTKKACTEPCSLKQFGECFVEMTEISFFLMTARSNKQLICNTRTSVKACVERNLVQCQGDIGTIMTAVLNPFVRIFDIVSESFCERDIDFDEADEPNIKLAGQCIVDFAKVAAHGSLLATCRQAQISLKCVQEATFSCSDRRRNIFSMITTVMENTIVAACTPDRCNLGIAELCIQKAYSTLSGPLYRDGGSIISCSWLKSAIDCAFTNSVDCIGMYTGGDNQTVSGNEPAEVDVPEVKDYLVFIGKMKKKWEEMNGETWDDAGDKNGVEKLEKRLDDIKQRVSTLVEELKGDEGEKVKDTNTLLNTVADFEAEFTDLKNRIRNAMSGEDVQRNTKRLETMREQLNIFLKKNDKTIRTDLPDEVRAQIDEMNAYLEMQVDTQTKELKDRFEMVRLSLMFLNTKVEEFCQAPRGIDVKDLEPGFDMILVLGALLDNPFSNKEKICSMVDKLNISFEAMEADMEIPVDIAKSIQRSLEYAQIIVGHMCQEPVEAEEVECIPVEKPEPVCDPVGAVRCVNFKQFATDLKVAIRDNSFDQICQAAIDGTDCYKHNTAICTDIPAEAKNFETRFKLLIGNKCDYYKPVPECKPPPVCDPFGAVEKCFPPPGQEVCPFISGEVLPCLQEKLEACTHSSQVVPVQAKMDYYFSVHDPEETCEIDTNLMYDDVTKPVAECNVESMITFQGALHTQANFSNALCMMLSAYVECMEPKMAEVNYLQQFLLSRHSAFYMRFWNDSCGHFMDRGNESAPIGALPDWDGCNMSMAVDGINKFWLTTTQVVGVDYSTDMYAENCRQENYGALEVLLSGDPLGACSESAVRFLQGGLPFFSDMRQEYCPLEAKDPERNCSVEGARQCIRKLSMIAALASPYMEICGHFLETYDCIAKYSVGCNETSVTDIAQEVINLKWILGDVDCEQPSWCPGERNAGMETPAEGEHVAPMSTAEIVEKLCSVNGNCSLMFETCLKNTTEETCRSSDEVKACIATQMTYCQFPQLSLAGAVITSYTDDTLDIEGCSIIPNILLNISDFNFVSCWNNMLQTDFTNKSGACNGISAYTQCLRSDLDEYSVYQGMYTVLAQMLENYHADFCTLPAEEPVTEECEDGTVIAENIHTLIKSALVLPFYPLLDRPKLCSSGKQLFENTAALIDGCTGNSGKHFEHALTFIGRLIDTLGFCSENPMPRECDTNKAMACVSELEFALLDAKKSGFKHAMCSQELLTEMCVGTSILGCKSPVKHIIENTYMEVKSVVDTVCTPPRMPEPSMQCALDGEPGSGCNTSAAVSCMFALYSDLACDNPDWKMVCKSVPFMTACVDRHLYQCSSEQRSVVMEIANKLRSRVKDHCPQVTCDVCGAQRCLVKLDGMWGKDNFCSLAMDVQTCVKTATTGCDVEYAGAFWLRMEEINQQIDLVCMGRFHMCMNDFRESAWEILLYTGPTLKPDVDENAPDTVSKATVPKDTVSKAKRRRREAEDPEEDGVTASKEKSAAVKSTGSQKSAVKKSTGSQKSAAKKSTGSQKSSAEKSTGSKDSNSKDQTDVPQEGNSYCDEYYNPDEPWMNNNLAEFLTELIPEENQGKNGESGSESGSSGSEDSGDDGQSGSATVKETGSKKAKSQNADKETASKQASKEKEKSVAKRRRRSAEAAKSAGKKATNSKEKNSVPKDDGAHNSTENKNVTLPNKPTKCVEQRPTLLHPDLHALCLKMYASLECVESHLFLLDRDIRETVKISLQGVLQIASQKCKVSPPRPMQCYSCDKASSHEECNAQPAETCASQKQTCETVVKTGKNAYISKKCVVPNSCKDKCNGNNLCKSCCTGHLCNSGSNTTTPAPVDPVQTCDLYTQTYCALSMASGLVKSKNMDCRLLFQSIQCMSTMNDSCISSDLGLLMQAYTKRLRTSKAWAYCLAKERDCQCGANAVVSLNAVFNPYTTIENGCRQLSVAHNISTQIDREQCSEDDIIYLGTNIEVRFSVLGQNCTREPEPEVEAVCPVLPAEREEDCRQQELECSTGLNKCAEGEMCCTYNCGEMCMVPIGGSPRNDTQDKAGFCPLVREGEISTCQYECSHDSECEGVKKCCRQACGGGVCRDPLPEEPMETVPCGKGVKEVQCLVNACDFANCTNFPNATCIHVGCGGCYAQFIYKDMDVTSMCHRPVVPARCSLAVALGNVDSCEEEEMAERYFFNSKTGECEKFNYTGCGGNDNNFETKAACLSACRESCSSPPAGGSCGLAMDSWYFDAENGTCKKFKYSGCAGNKNRYNTQEQCMTSCVSRPVLEEMCSRVGDALVEMSNKTKPVIKVLPQELVCNMLKSQVFPAAQSLLAGCHVNVTRKQLETDFHTMLKFDWSVCKEEDSGMVEPGEVTLCNSNRAIREACHVELNHTDPKVCSKLQSMIECLHNKSTGCNFIQLYPLFGELKDQMIALTSKGVSCRPNITDMPDNPLNAVFSCVQDFLYQLETSLSGSFIVAGKSTDMCSASATFRRCIYGIPDLPVKHQAKQMVDMATGLDGCLCNDVEIEEQEEPNTQQPLQCYVCQRESNNTVCNEATETCPFNKQSCQTIVEIKNGELTINKGCKNPTASEAMVKCQTTGSKVFCRYSCTENLCNEPLQLNDTTEEKLENRKKRQLDEEIVTEAETCKYAEIGKLASSFMRRLFTLSFAHVDDYLAFCSNLNNTAAVVTEWKTGCSANMTDRIDAVSSCLGSLAMMSCPQPISSEEEETEEEPVCDWQKCVTPIQSYFSTVGSDPKCSHIQKSLTCLKNTIQDCNNTQRTAIQKTLELLRNISPNLTCSDTLNDVICQTSQSNDSKCDFTPSTCDLISAVDVSQKFIRNNTGNIGKVNCSLELDVEDNMVQYLDGCHAVSLSVAESAIVTGGQLLNACPSSLTITVEDHPWRVCISNFTENFELSNICGSFGALLSCFKTTPTPSTFDADIMTSHLDILKSFVYSCNKSEPKPKPEVKAECPQELPAEREEECQQLELECSSGLDKCAEGEMCCTYNCGEMCMVPLGGTPQNNTQGGVSTGAGCHTEFEAQCMLSYGTLFFVGPFLPRDQKVNICKSFETKMAACGLYLTNCSSDHITMLKNLFATFRNTSTMCSEPEEPEWPEEPVTPEGPKCDPKTALTYISELGISLSKCVTSVKLTDQVCKSVKFVEVQIHSAVEVCPAVVKQQVLASWTLVKEQVSQVCAGEKPPTDPLVPDNTPVCVLVDYSNPKGDCQPSSALACLARLENAVFETKGTQNRFCAMMRHTVRCFVDHTTNCDPFLVSAINPLMHRLFTDFAGQCPDTWCPVEEEPGVCDLEVARECVTTLKITLGENKEKACLMIDQTKQCINRATVDCTGERKLLVKEFDRSVESLSAIACAVTEKPPVDAMACINNYKRLAFELLDFGNIIIGNVSVNISDGNATEVDLDMNTENDTEVNLDKDLENGVNSNAADDDVVVATNKTASKAVKESKVAEKATNSKEAGKAANSKESKAKTAGVDDPFKEEEASREIFVREDSRVYEDTVNAMCIQLELAWACVEESLGTLGAKQHIVVSKMLIGIKAAVVEKCKPMHCYTCSGLDSNNVCNAQPTCACPAGTQMCYSSLENGTYTKGCAASDTCKECEGKEDCYCCHGHKCNAVDPTTGPENCTVGMAIECAFSLVNVTMETEELTLSHIEANLQCVIEHTQGCRASRYYMLYTICIEIGEMFNRGVCVSKYGDPLCGTSGILALGYIMQNPYRWKTSVCRQYRATGTSVEKVVVEDACKESDILHLQNAYTYVSGQLVGYCDVSEEILMGVCDVEMAISKCVEQKTWLKTGSSECSNAMFEAFKTCCINYTSGCNSAERSVLFIPATQHVQLASVNCDDEVTTDLDTLIADIFVIDELSVITNSYLTFVQNIQQSLTFGSLNFLEDLCKYAKNLTSELTAVELSPLMALYSTQNVDRIMGQLEEVCNDTSVTDDAVKEECSQIELDIVIVLDSSGSIGEIKFELVRGFADNVIRLADVESGNVRIGVLQFATIVTPLFHLNDYMVNGTQNKEAMLQEIADMIYTKGKTNTADAINEAANVFLSKAMGAREGVPKHILVITDGESTVNPEKTIPAANNAKAMGIKVFAVGIKMEEEKQIKELEGIASAPKELNVLRLQEFDELDGVFRKIFRLFCRTSQKSECNLMDIVYNSTNALVYSMTSSYAKVEDSAKICSKIDSLYESVSTLSATCVSFEKGALQLVQSLIMSQSQETCLVYRQEEYDPTCDLSMATLCVTDMAQFLRASKWSDEMMCNKVESALQCLNYYAIACANVDPILVELKMARSILQHRCPDQLLSLQCWGAKNFSGETTDDTKPDSKSCDLVSMVKNCVKDINWKVNVLSSPCTTLMEKAQGAMTCAISAFVSASCSPKLLQDLTDLFLGEDTEIYSFLRLGGLCTVPSELAVSLPEGYGKEEPLTCADANECNTDAAMECLKSLEPEDDENGECRNWSQVHTCIMGAISSCNDVNYLLTMSAVRLSVVAAGLPDTCTATTVWQKQGKDVFVNTCLKNLQTAIGNFTPACKFLPAFLVCLNSEESPTFTEALHSRVNLLMSHLLMGYCSEEPELEESDKDCSVSPEEKMCVSVYATSAVSNLFIGQSGKLHFCDMSSKCMMPNPNCSRAQPYGKLWESYNLLQTYTFTSDVCADEAIMCSEQSAMNCISQLGEAVTLHNYMESGDADVCEALAHTRKCLRLTLRDCTKKQQTSIISTFREVECLALDICTSGKEEEPVPTREPAECVDPAIVSPNAACRLTDALTCIRNFSIIAKNPFAKDNNTACLAYSDMLQCVFDNSVDCTDVEEKIVTVLLNLTVMHAAEMGCKSQIRSPCIETDDCGLAMAKTCVDDFYYSFEHYIGLNTVCTQIEAVRACIDASLKNCSKTAESEIGAMYTAMVKFANINCTHDFPNCATKYVHYIQQILVWKAYVEPPPVVVPVPVPAGTSSKAKKNSKEVVTAAPTTKKPVDTFALRVKELKIMCEQFALAWTCVQKDWVVLDGPVLALVQASFTAYHATIMEICVGPRDGYCPAREGKMSVEDCDTDLDCSGVKKCCSIGSGHVCTKPNPHVPKCYDALVQTTKTSFQLIQSLYLNTDNGVKFCSLYAATENVVNITLNLVDCPAEYKGGLQKTWTACKSAFKVYCVVPPKPPATCVKADAQACLTSYNSNDLGKTNDQKCTLLEVLKACIKPILAKCDSKLTAENTIIVEINAQVKKIQDSLVCAQMPEVKLSIVTNNIVVVEGDIPGKSVDVVLDKSPADFCGASQVCKVKIVYNVTDYKDKMPKCSGGTAIRQLLVGNLCEMMFSATNWNVTQTFTLTARLDMKVDGDYLAKFTLRATLVIDTVEVLTKTIKEYSVVVVDSDKPAMCHSVNDPHIRTFDGVKYDNFHQGEFLMYRHLVYPFEVRAYFTTCNTGMKSATCNCGVCVLVGDDTFCINKCYGNNERTKTKPTMWQNGVLMDNFRIYESNDGESYLVILPTGSRVQIDARKIKGKKAKKNKEKNENYVEFLNIYITPSPMDWGHTTGLCGNYDGNQKNDITGPDGQVFTGIDLKIQSGTAWHLAWRTKDTMEYIFQGVPANPNLPIINGSSCQSTGAKCVCDPSDYIEMCEIVKGVEVTTTIQEGPINRRRKRDVGDPLAGMIIDIAAIPEPAAFPTKSGITLEQANTTCYNALTGAAFAATCATILPPDDLVTKLQDCVDDIMFVDDLETDFIRAAVDSLSRQCENIAKADTNSTLINLVKDVTCPNGCSQHGQCNNGTCECDAGFSAADCSIDIAVPPVLQQLADSVCESIIQSTCQRVRLFGDDFINGSVCHLEKIMVTETGINKTSSTMVNVPATWMSFDEVTCDLTMSGSLPLHTVLVSISNNGLVSSMSEQQLFIAHNPICFACTKDSQLNGTCKKERASCYVDGVCYRPLEPMHSSPCNICDVYTGQMVYQVSAACPPLTTTLKPYESDVKAQEMNDTTVIGISAGAAGLVLLIVIIVLAVVLYRYVHSSRNGNDRKELTHRTSRHSDDTDSGEFKEIAYPAFSNHGYHGYHGYPAMYVDQPQDLFANYIPKRVSWSSCSDPTRDHEYDQRRHNRHSADVYIHSQT